MMNPEVKAEWVAALRSGEYQQGSGSLRTITVLKSAHATYCCLGVLCDLYAKKGEGEWIGKDFLFGEADDDFNHEGTGILPENLRKVVGLEDGNPNTSVYSGGNDLYPSAQLSLAELNDGKYGVPKWSFEEIADLIEREL